MKCTTQAMCEYKRDSDTCVYDYDCKSKIYEWKDTHWAWNIVCIIILLFGIAGAVSLVVLACGH